MAGIFDKHEYDDADLASMGIASSETERAAEPTDTELTPPKGRPKATQLIGVYPSEELMNSREPIVDFSPDKNKSKEERVEDRRVDPRYIKEKTQESAQKPLSPANQIIKQNVSDRHYLKAQAKALQLAIEEAYPCDSNVHDIPGGLPDDLICAKCHESKSPGFDFMKGMKSVKKIFNLRASIAAHNKMVEIHNNHCGAKYCSDYCILNQADFNHRKECHEGASCGGNCGGVVHVNDDDGKVWHCSSDCDHIVGQKDWFDSPETPGVLGRMDKLRQKAMLEGRDPTKKDTHGSESGCSPEAFNLSAWRTLKDDFKGVDPKLTMDDRAYLIVNNNTVDPDARLRNSELQDTFESHRSSPWGATKKLNKKIPTITDPLYSKPDIFGNTGEHHEKFKKDCAEYAEALKNIATERTAEDRQVGPERQRVMMTDAASTAGWTDPQQFAFRLATSADGKTHRMASFGRPTALRYEDYRSRTLGSPQQQKPIVYEDGEAVNRSYDNEKDMKERSGLTTHVNNIWNKMKAKLGTFSPVRKGAWTIMEVPDTHVIPLTDELASLVATVGHHKAYVNRSEVDPTWAAKNPGKDEKIAVQEVHRLDTQLTAEGLRNAILTTPNNQVKRELTREGGVVNRKFGISAGDEDSLVPEFKGSEVERIAARKHNLYLPELDENPYGNSEAEMPMAEEPGFLKGSENREAIARNLVETVDKHRKRTTGQGLTDEQKEKFVEAVKPEGNDLSHGLKALGLEEDQN